MKKLRISIIIFKTILMAFPAIAQTNAIEQNQQGTLVQITTDNNSQYMGKLSGLSNDRLILLDPENKRKAIEIDSISKIKEIRRVEGTAVSKGIIKGGLIGASIGGVTGLLAGDTSSGDFLGFSRTENTVWTAISGGLLGGIIGGLSGLNSGGDKVYRLSGKDKSEKKQIIREIMARYENQSAIH